MTIQLKLTIATVILTSCFNIALAVESNATNLEPEQNTVQLEDFYSRQAINIIDPNFSSLVEVEQQKLPSPDSFKPTYFESLTQSLHINLPDDEVSFDISNISAADNTLFDEANSKSKLSRFIRRNSATTMYIIESVLPDIDLKGSDLLALPISAMKVLMAGCSADGVGFDMSQVPSTGTDIARHLNLETSRSIDRVTKISHILSALRNKKTRSIYQCEGDLLRDLSYSPPIGPTKTLYFEHFDSSHGSR